jgi:large conductance mechanosensitive channel
MGMLKEFKEFAVRGNLVDMAVAFVMGGAFGKVTSAFIDGIVMPLVGQLSGGVDLSDKKLILTPAVSEVKDVAGNVLSPATSEVAVHWGAFVTVTMELLVVSFVMFILIKGINRLRKQEAAAPAPPPAPTNEEKLLMEIRDALKK